MSCNDGQMVVTPVWDSPRTRPRYVLDVSSSPLEISRKYPEEPERKVDDNDFCPLHIPTRENDGAKDTNAVDLNHEQARSTGQNGSAKDKARRMPRDMRSHNMHSKARLRVDMQRYLGRKEFISNEYLGQSVDDIPGNQPSPYSIMPKESPVSLSSNACLSTTLRLGEPIHIKPSNVHVDSKTHNSATSLYDNVVPPGDITLLTPPTIILSSHGSNFSGRVEPFLGKLGAYHSMDEHNVIGLAKEYHLPSKPTYRAELANTSSQGHESTFGTTPDGEKISTEDCTSSCDLDVSDSNSSDGTTPIQAVEVKSHAITKLQQRNVAKANTSMARPRQIGLARVRTEILSIAGTRRAQRLSKSSKSSDNASEEAIQDEPEESVLEQSKEQQAEWRPPNSCDYVPSTQASGGNRDASSSTNPNRGQRGDPDDGNYDTNEENTAQTQNSLSGPIRSQSSQRFACPYQAFEQFQGCFRPGPRNPNGGCASIQRLK
jgi:hypothetical protein